MPITLVRSENTHCLWNHCKNSFLDQIGTNTGPGDYPSFLWVTNRNLRDSFLECAQSRGLKGWLGPPFRTWNELPESFEINQQSIGQLTRQLLISTISSRAAQKVDFVHYQKTRHGILPGRILDRLFGELLPEGISADNLEKGFESLRITNDFVEKRNRWIVETYKQYLEALDTKNLRDTRATNSILAGKIEAGGLSVAIGNAETLHIYGTANLQGKQRLFRALGEQSQIIVKIYLASEEGESEWAALSTKTEYVEPLENRFASIHLTANAEQEAKWVAGKIKETLITTQSEPHEIAVISRDFINDSPRILDELRDAGIPITTRNNIPLMECGAIKAFLELFSAASKRWDYTGLRNVVTNSYFDTGIDLRVIDKIGSLWQLSGLPTWEEKISSLESEATYEPASIQDLSSGQRSQAQSFKDFKAILDPLSETHTLSDWMKLTIELIRSNPFKIRDRLSEPVGNNWLIVRLDQRGLSLLESVLREWSEIEDSKGPTHVLEWYSQLLQILSIQNLSLETPMKKGVQVMSAVEGALTPFKHTFIVHANHGVFPKSFSNFGNLTNQDRILLSKSGIPLVHQTNYQQWEESLWQGLVQQPNVAISYRKTDEDGTQLDPSYLLPNSQESVLIENEHSQDLLTNKTSLLLQGAKNLGQNWENRSAVPVEVTEPELLEHALLVAYSESQRPGPADLELDGSPIKPNPWNGHLTDPDVVKHLTKKFGDDHVWSPTSLMDYSIFPFQFWVNKVLEIEKHAKLENNAEAKTLGTVAHTILERFYLPIADGDIQQPEELDDRSEQRLLKITKEIAEELQEEGQWLGNPFLWTVKWNKLLNDVENYLKWELKQLKKTQESPILVEYRFGYKDFPAVVISGSDMEGIKRTIRVKGIIDRVDRSHSEGSPQNLAVIDYKLKNIPATQYIDGTLLQTPIYLLALEQLGHDISNSRGFYRNIKTNPGKNPTIAGKEVGGEKKKGIDAWREVQKFIFAIPSRIQNGMFEAVYCTRPGSKWRVGVEVSRSNASIPASIGNRFDE